MQATRALWARQPMIRFLGKRSVPKNIDHTPHVHPAAPAESLPESFAQYRNRATQHGPLGGQEQQTQQRSGAPSQASANAAAAATQPYGQIGGRSAQQLGSVQPAKGEVWDREELPARFRRRPWSEGEMEAIESGGASLFG